jgi:pimeloyl-ACP methyl ester carboxylesterase
VADIPEKAKTEDVVVLLHGIGHSRWNMAMVERGMRRAGFSVLNLSYPSRTRTIEAIAAFLHERLRKKNLWQEGKRVHFVTHSMGGLVVRYYLEKYKSEIPRGKLGRVVMIAPPIGGSEVADFLKNFLPYKWMFGPAGQELVTAVRRADQTAPYYDLGIIAGSKKWPYVIANFIVRGEHDGRVAVVNTKLEGMKDHMVVPATHGFISWKASTHEQAVYFILNGAFKRER